MRTSSGRRSRMFNIFRGFKAITLKEFTSVLRDPMTLFFMLFPPLVEMIAFGFALDNDVKYMATVVYNEDKSSESRRLLYVRKYRNLPNRARGPKRRRARG